MRFHRCEQAGFAQLAREGTARVPDGIVGYEPVNAAALIVVKEVELAVVVLAEGDNPQIGLGQFLVRNDAVPVKTGAPDFSCHPVATEVGTYQILQTFAAV